MYLFLLNFTLLNLFVVFNTYATHPASSLKHYCKDLNSKPLRFEPYKCSLGVFEMIEPYNFSILIEDEYWGKELDEIDCKIRGRQIFEMIALVEPVEEEKVKLEIIIQPRLVNGSSECVHELSNYFYYHQEFERVSNFKLNQKGLLKVRRNIETPLKAIGKLHIGSPEGVNLIPLDSETEEYKRYSSGKGYLPLYKE